MEWRKSGVVLNYSRDVSLVMTHYVKTRTKYNATCNTDTLYDISLIYSVERAPGYCVAQARGTL